MYNSMIFFKPSILRLKMLVNILQFTLSIFRVKVKQIKSDTVVDLAKSERYFDLVKNRQSLFYSQFLSHIFFVVKRVFVIPILKKVHQSIWLGIVHIWKRIPFLSKIKRQLDKVFVLFYVKVICTIKWHI